MGKANAIGRGALVLVVALALPLRAEDAVKAGAPANGRQFRIEKDIVYARSGDTDLLLDAYLPSKAEGALPAVLVVHGGAWRSGNKMQLAPYALALVNRGYAAFAINYRLAPLHKFPAQIEDCRAAVKWIRDQASKYRVDPDRVGGIGYSAGGHLVSLLGVEGKTQPNGRLQAVVAGGAPVEFRTVRNDSKTLIDFLGGNHVEKADLYAIASPMKWISTGAPPFFFFHGTDDELVGIVNVEKMVAALKDSGTTAELYRVDKARHIPAALNREALTKSLDFLDKHLKASSAASKSAAANG